jgi:hypothetical protein
MYVLAHHQISKPEEFLAIIQSETKFPEGFKVHAFLPAVSHKTATCIWEAPDAKALENLIEPVLGKTSVNTYVEVDEGIAMGLPRLEEAVMQH